MAFRNSNTNKDRWEVVAFIKREGQEKAWAQRIGSATPKDDGGFWLSLNALPFCDGRSEVTIAISPPYNREERSGGGGGNYRDRGRSDNFGRGSSGRRADPPPPQDEEEDEVPFN